MIRSYTVAEIWCATEGQTDRSTNRQKKRHIEVGAPHKKPYKKIWAEVNKY